MDKDKELFEYSLTTMSSQFMAAFLSRPMNPPTEGRFYSLTDEDMEAMSHQAVLLAHHLMIKIQEVVDEFPEE